jgi:hypothetical protein
VEELAAPLGREGAQQLLGVAAQTGAAAGGRGRQGGGPPEEDPAGQREGDHQQVQHADEGDGVEPPVPALDPGAAVPVGRGLAARGLQCRHACSRLHLDVLERPAADRSPMPPARRQVNPDI